MTTEWIPTGGKKPILPSHVFVYVRFAGDSREEAEAYRDGYGQSVDSVHSWADTIEYRRKHPAPMTNDQTVTQADRDAAAEYMRLFPELRLPEAFARHRTAHSGEAPCRMCLGVRIVAGEVCAHCIGVGYLSAHSGEGRSNGAGEDAVEAVAQWLHDEGGFGDSWTAHTWPEHPGDTGQREGGWVKIVPSDVQAQFRDVARRLLTQTSAAALAQPEAGGE